MHRHRSKRRSHRSALVEHQFVTTTTTCINAFRWMVSQCLSFSSVQWCSPTACPARAASRLPRRSSCRHTGRARLVLESGARRRNGVVFESIPRILVLPSFSFIMLVLVYSDLYLQLSLSLFSFVDRASFRKTNQ